MKVLLAAILTAITVAPAYAQQRGVFIGVGDDPGLRSPHAKVLLIEVGDYQGPLDGRAAPRPRFQDTERRFAAVGGVFLVPPNRAYGILDDVYATIAIMSSSVRFFTTGCIIADQAPWRPPSLKSYSCRNV